MADYWKSQDKKFCDVCKCWLTDNKVSVEFHENGKRHKENVQKRLKDIQKKNKVDEKKEKRFEDDLKRIEKAAMSAYQKDMEDNPDMSMKIQKYQDMLNDSGGDPSADDPTSGSSKDFEPKILHRSEKEKKAEEAAAAKEIKPFKPYSRHTGWETVSAKSSFDLELPNSKSVISSGPILFQAKVQEKRRIQFNEKTLPTEPSASVGGFVVKSEPEVAFKKRKFDKSKTMRRREDD